MVTPLVLWSCIVGLAYFAAGVFLLRRELFPSSSTLRASATLPETFLSILLDKLVLAGPTLAAASIAVFGMEHFFAAPQLQQAVPAWIPAHLFFVYFVGAAHLAAALSFIARRLIGLSAALLGIMIWIFVLTLHIPNLIAQPHDRSIWVVVLRDMTFASCALAFAATRTQAWRTHRRHWLILMARVIASAALALFAGVYLLNPAIAPGVPNGKLTPAPVPFPFLWGFLTGLCLLAGAIALWIPSRARAALSWLGLLMFLLTWVLFLPILIASQGTAAQVEAMNYVADTLYFGATLLLLAAALPRNRPFLTEVVAQPAA
jgi:uncharacterized membrane protein